MHVQSCCFANQTYCFFAVVVAVAVVVAKALWFCFEFSQHPLVFISGYANMENVFYCLNVWASPVYHSASTRAYARQIHKPSLHGEF